MSFLIIGPNEKAAIKAAIDHARNNVIPWSILQAGAIGTPTDTLSLAERKPGLERPASEHIILGAYHVAFSFEEQPAGICRHISMSPIPKHPAIFDRIATEFGFDKFHRIWREEYDPGRWALNAIELVEES